ncbi:MULTISPECIES: CDP-diacylglycerol diphosphatase [Gordonia]|uniref:CDP-diacylglycerol diphosphatase n=1 Tax=Gordonia TaxID=2053 RepID=UPI001EF699E7|nr:CDP-diacylglycerol diphosphatase [Gordonia sp. McavH-238-E]MCG7631460.1 CDP-diacylglycerol diphosphatase [Gordonia sp. McavH-238-E]
MDDTRSHRFTRLLPTMAVTAAIVASTALSGGGVASAAPPTPTQKLCGQSTDNPKTDDRLWLWGKVKGTTPKKPGDNREVVQPAAQVQPNKKKPKFYAVRRGGDSQGVNDDFLVVPTNRIRGIECPYLWDGSQLNLWSAAWWQGGMLVAKDPAKPLAIGVNSVQKRGQDQLHIHMAQVHPDTLRDLKAMSHPETSLYGWTKTDVKLHIDPKKTAGDVERHFHVVKYTGALPDLFKVLRSQLTAGQDIGTYSIGVVDAGQPNTYFVLASAPTLGGGKDTGTGSMDQIYAWVHK